ncbi:potassium channel family protein [Fulvivirga lutea]|uniref:NAD-binding protein n=1 Tax=Fulvivirga lutea TaxID=2810512 RepID=A0A974WL14_9BACT|nr:potassium channel family protein [Fulvivirga lutea]QSE97323.1 NAD-binding protein [Fulvivirga lutea]
MAKLSNVLRIGIIILGFMVGYAMLTAILFYFESQDPNATIKDYGDAIWFAMVTLTTVGYGDLTPVTQEGRIFGSIFLLASLGFYGVMIGQISSIMNTIRENNKLGMNGTNFTNHVVMVGWSDFGKAVIDQLIAAGRQVAVVTKEKDNIDIIREFYPNKNVFTLFSDYSNVEMLTKLNVEECSIIFVNLDDDTEKLVYILNLKKQFSDLKYVVTLDNANLKTTFQSAGVTYAVSKHEIASRLLASYIFEPDVAEYSEEILSYPQTDEHYDIKQYKVLKDNPYNGQFYDKVFYDIKKEFNVVLIGIVKIEDGKRTLMKNPEETVKISEEDYLIMIINKNSVKKLKRFFNVDEGYL